MKLHDINLALSKNNKLPIILQSEAAECGLACLAMVLSYHGMHATLLSLRQQYNMSLKGASLKDVISIANKSELNTRPVRLELDELSSLKTPCILHWDLNHFVVLKKCHPRHIVIHDPASGIKKISFEEASKRFSGIALELYPSAKFETVEKKPGIRIRSLIGNIQGLKRALGHIFILAIAMEFFVVISPLFLQLVVDHALVTYDKNLITSLVIGFILLLVIRVTISSMRGLLMIKMGATLNVQSHANLYTHLLRLPISYFETRHLSDVISRFDSQYIILNAVTRNIIEALLDGLLAIITLTVMFVYAPTLAWIVVIGALIYAVLRWIFYYALRQSSSEEIIWTAKRDSHFLETIRGIKVIKLFNGENERKSHWLNLLIESLNRNISIQKLQLMFDNVNLFLRGIMGILVIWVASSSILTNTFSIGMLFAFIVYKDQFLERVSALIDRALELKMLNIHAERLADIALMPPEFDAMNNSSNNLPVSKNQAVSVSLSHLNFRYSENDEYIYQELNLEIKPGESIAIIGKSGSGKTTLLKLIASLLQPTSGDISINNTTLTNIGINQYRAMIGVVMQDDELFAGSIAENICFFSSQPEYELIESCAKQAAVHRDILDMPMGYNTLIGDMGSVLSGGQKQRVLIARALYKKPGLLLLDEATSHLDIESESIVNSAIKHSNATKIIIAHRTETIVTADRVIQLENGKLNEVDKRSIKHLSNKSDDRYSTDISNGSDEDVTLEESCNISNINSSSYNKTIVNNIITDKLKITVACQDRRLRDSIFHILSTNKNLIVTTIPFDNVCIAKIDSYQTDALILEMDNNFDFDITQLHLLNKDFITLYNDKQQSIQQINDKPSEYLSKVCLKLASIFPHHMTSMLSIIDKQRNNPYGMPNIAN